MSFLNVYSINKYNALNFNKVLLKSFLKYNKIILKSYIVILILLIYWMVLFIVKYKY